MSPARIVPCLAVLASVVTGCADTDEEITTSEEQKERSSLSVADDGVMPPMPEPLDVPMPWTRNDFGRPFAPKPLAEDLRDPLGPKGDCALTYVKIHDPVLREPIEIAIVVCH